MPRKSRQKEDKENGNLDEQWRQAWRSPGDMGMQHKQRLLNNINDRIDNSRRRTKQLFFIGMSAAAAMLVAVFIKLPGNNLSAPVRNWQELASAGNAKKVLLKDGSVVWLAPYSSVKINADFSQQRSTVLSKGTAFFAVAKDPQHPFTIDVNSQQVTVVGTAFTIRKLDSIDLQLTVKEGRVRLNNPGGDQLITAGQQVHTSKAVTGTVATIDPEAADWWLQQQVRLLNITLEDLISRIETYYQVTLTTGAINKKLKVSLTWDLSVSIEDNLTVLNTLTGYNIHL